MKPNPAVDLNGLRFPHPVLAASGCLATGHDVPALVELHKLGGVVTRSLTFGPSKGWPTPRSAETSSGLLSAVGLQNPGVLDFIDRDLPRLAKVGVPVVASVAGSSLGEYVDVTSAMHLKHGVVAIEVCPIQACTVAASTPLASQRHAAVCRRSWIRRHRRSSTTPLSA